VMFFPRGEVGVGLAEVFLGHMTREKSRLWNRVVRGEHARNIMLRGLVGDTPDKIREELKCG
jgi:hypothetical protein